MIHPFAAITAGMQGTELGTVNPSLGCARPLPSESRRTA